MSIPALGEAAANLPWLSPCAATLAAVARAASPSVWNEVRFDPGLVLHLVRQPCASDMSSLPALLTQAPLLQSVLHHWADGHGCFVDWNHSTAAPVYSAAAAFARLAAFIAERTGRSNPDHAWIGGMLAPLGQIALVAAELGAPGKFARPQEIRLFPEPTEQIDATAVARRLSVSWHLPNWLAAITGHLALPLDVARMLGADDDLFQIIQLSVGVVERHGAGLGLKVGSDPQRVATTLGLTTADLSAINDLLAAVASPSSLPARWESPSQVPLLADLLRLAVENRRLGQATAMDRLHHQLDALHQAVAEQRTGEAERLLSHKLSALAELAAGAGHEINNPLAVISGQAQYLLNREEDSAHRRSLQTIIGQTQRIHQTLTGLMQFARPPVPKSLPVDVGPILRDVAATLQSTAEDKQIQLTCSEVLPPAAVHADPAQLRTALICLLRNAIEAAPVAGWASMRIEVTEAKCLRFVIEDNGKGLSDIDREHLFDPFYSGRKAGRGRGLGLSTAWRLAQQHGGEVRHEDAAGGPTRFVLTWPRAELTNLPSPSLAPDPETPPLDVAPVVFAADAAAPVNGCHTAAVSDV